MSVTLQQIARALGGEIRGQQVAAPGPGHSASDRSLSVKIDHQAPGGFIVFSHAGDDAILCKDYVREKLGFEPFKPNGSGPRPSIEAVYEYTDENGTPLFQVVRFKPKNFRQRRSNGNGGWIWSIGETRRVLYRLPELAEAIASDRPVFVVEGEKAVDRLAQIGITATCSPGGAGKWRAQYSEHLEGAEVIILPDNDEPGWSHAKSVAAALEGVASNVRVLRLPDLPEKGDAFDWIEAGGSAIELWNLAEKESQPESTAADIPLTLEEWFARDLPEPDNLLGGWLNTTSRALIAAPTGLGKTMLGTGLLLALGKGDDFLHWRAGRACRVLYIDGEMSRRELRRRLRDAVRRSGGEMPEGVRVLSKEDVEDMPPLNAPTGQQWLDCFLAKHGPFDLVIFDNIQALLVGDMKDEQQWADVLPYVRSLTRRSIGQIWFHHTGHDETKSYGSKAREWQMDIVGLLERIEVPGADLAFTLKFTKARERTPENRNDFEPVTIQLVDDQWQHASLSSAASSKLTPNQQTVLRLLEEAKPDGLTLEEWNAKARAEGIGVRRRADLNDIRAELKRRKLIHSYADKWHVTNA